MNRKILDVTMLCTLCICLMVAANIEEKNTIRESREEISSAYVISAADKAEVPVAGVCRVLSGYSFTTESDEATGITKNPRTMVASTAPSDAAEEVQVPTEDAETPEAKVQAASEEAEAPGGGREQACDGRDDGRCREPLEYHIDAGGDRFVGKNRLAGIAGQSRQKGRKPWSR